VGRQSFAKYSGCGNDFIFFDGIGTSVAHQIDAAFIQAVCHRDKGIGADGVVVVEKASPPADAAMRIFNSDGSEAAMCGNALRCVLPFLCAQLRWPRRPYHIKTAHYTHKVQFSPDGVTATMSPPYKLSWDITLNIPSHGPLLVHYLDTGVPHAVFFTEQLYGDNFFKLARAIRHHAEFIPLGVNVTAVQCAAGNNLLVRTFERGVEAETQACGTGATAAALAACRLGYSHSPVTVIPFSNKPLTISFIASGNSYRNVVISGEAQLLVEGFL